MSLFYGCLQVFLFVFGFQKFEYFFVFLVLAEHLESLVWYTTNLGRRLSCYFLRYFSQLFVSLLCGIQLHFMLFDLNFYSSWVFYSVFLNSFVFSLSFFHFEVTSIDLSSGSLILSYYIHSIYEPSKAFIISISFFTFLIIPFDSVLQFPWLLKLSTWYYMLSFFSTRSVKTLVILHPLFDTNNICIVSEASADEHFLL